MGKTGYLVLENGKIFRGERFGAEGEMTAEVVFTTGMTGYLETLTDRSYWGQMVVQTFPLIGNYGVIPADFESDAIGPCAYIVKQWCQAPSNFRSQGSLDTFFKEKGVIGLSGIDTRTLTKIIRETGVMNGVITDDPAAVDFEALKAYRVTGAVKASSTKERYVVRPEGEVKKKIALLDFGLKRNIYRELVKRGAEVTVCPCTTTAAEIKALGVDGIMLSNGPGDPAENVEVVENIRKLIGKKPILGICLGHQLFALAMGGQTRKMKYGHRGANQPVKDLSTGKVFITSQNHGYEVVSEAVKNGTLSFINANDGTCEGVDYPAVNATTVQFHPEACGGPHDANYLFDRFIANMRKEKGYAEEK